MTIGANFGAGKRACWYISSGDDGDSDAVGNMMLNETECHTEHILISFCIDDMPSPTEEMK